MKRIVLLGIIGLLKWDLSQKVNINEAAVFRLEAAQVKPAPPSKPLPRISCSFDLIPGQGLKVTAKLVNQAADDIFVLNHLWKLTPSSQFVADEQGAYRFVRDSELRLLWGIAPPPRLRTVTYRNIPFATPLKPGASLQLEQLIGLQAKEYSVYFPEEAKTTYIAARVNRVVAIVQFVDAQPSLAITPSPFPAAVKVSTPEALDSHRSVSCISPPTQIEVLRRTDEFDRFLMPNETPEPLVLAK